MLQETIKHVLKEQAAAGANIGSEAAREQIAAGILQRITEKVALWNFQHKQMITGVETGRLTVRSNVTPTA